MSAREEFAFTGWSEWDSVAYLLATPFLAAKVAAFVDAGACCIDWDGLIEASGAWSHGEQLVVGLASDLWRATGGVSVKELCASLDDATFERVVAALQIARGWPRCRGAFSGAVGGSAA